MTSIRYYPDLTVLFFLLIIQSVELAQLETINVIFGQSGRNYGNLFVSNSIIYIV